MCPPSMPERVSPDRGLLLQSMWAVPNPEPGASSSVDLFLSKEIRVELQLNWCRKAYREIILEENIVFATFLNRQ